ncbi:uncharacterized protein LOC127796274 isoform X3 [Diospyros lotus]|uniref:uncharacterized protein LOC127796274 isoform X3 n=1 Tax=Diospyros lotus TaxID=55363 RepID=UPI00224D9B1A|nr:uncharacterized protein LOC127796274 isoform X3 [Diospyros lotus]
MRNVDFVLLSMRMAKGEDNLTSNRLKTTEKVLVDENVGLFGKMIIEMLPEDLAFTVFVPSRRAFEHDLKLNENDSLAGEMFNNTHAILTRVLGFSAVPRIISSASVPLGEEIRYDSLSGFSLYTSKDPDGMLIVNGVRAEHVDLRKGKIAVHIMDGVIMDAEFERSFQPDDSEED